MKALNSDEVIAVIEAHAPHMSDENEEFIFESAGLMISSLGVERDPADLAIRTCRCGFAIDGFDEYVFHLKDVFRGNT